MEEHMIFCQSCGMPMTEPAHFGIEKDGSPSADYCVYCYKDGAFTMDCTMDQMIGHNLQFLAEFNKDSVTQYSPEQARAEMQQYFPTLKRWAAK